jgi:NADH-quinone oxidoreductase subunit L
MWIGTLSIIGFPFMSGYYSKDLILNASFNLKESGSIVYILLAIISAMTAFYSFRLIFKVFHGDYKGTYDYDKIHESNYLMLVPLFILSFGSIFAGYFFNQILSGHNSFDFWKGVIFLSQNDHHHSSIYTVLSKSMITFAILLCIYFYGFHLEKINKMKILFTHSYKFLLNKWFFDEFYNNYIVKPFYDSGLFLWKKIDQRLIDRFLPNGFALIVSKISLYCKKIQTGFIFDYTFVIIAGFTFFITIIFYFAVV